VAYEASTGVKLWAKRYNGPGNGDDQAYSVAVPPRSARGIGARRASSRSPTMGRPTVPTSRSPDHASAMAQLHQVCSMLRPKFPDAVALLENAAEDVLAHMHFPREHRRRLHSTNPLERLHKEIKRRTRVVGIFPTRDSLMRMVGTLLAEQDDEWQVMDRRYFSLGSMAKIDALEGGEDPKQLLAQIA